MNQSKIVNILENAMVCKEILVLIGWHMLLRPIQLRMQMFSPYRVEMSCFWLQPKIFPHIVSLDISLKKTQLPNFGLVGHALGVENKNDALDAPFMQ